MFISKQNLLTVLIVPFVTVSLMTGCSSSNNDKDKSSIQPIDKTTNQKTNDEKAKEDNQATKDKDSQSKDDTKTDNSKNRKDEQQTTDDKGKNDNNDQ